MKVSEDLLQILATTEIANISQSIEYQKLCQANVGDSRFQAERDRVERIKIRVEANLKPPLTTIEEAKAALSLLIRSRRVTEDRDLYHALLVRGYKARWTNKQQAYFDDAWEKIRLEYDFFFSFTTRYPRVEGKTPSIRPTSISLSRNWSAPRGIVRTARRKTCSQRQCFAYS